MSMLTAKSDLHEILRAAGHYPLEAYLFVEAGLSWTVDRLQEPATTHGFNEFERHLSGQELCMGLRDMAINRFGLLAPTVLKVWNVHRTEDFGAIVFNLADVGILHREAEEQVEDFHGVYDFREAFDPRDLATHIGSAQQGN